MTEPRIQYAQTKDGVSIAYWTLGEGKPLVLMASLPHSPIELECQMPAHLLGKPRGCEYNGAANAG